MHQKVRLGGCRRPTENLCKVQSGGHRILHTLVVRLELRVPKIKKLNPKKIAKYRNVKMFLRKAASSGSTSSGMAWYGSVVRASQDLALWLGSQSLFGSAIPEEPSGSLQSVPWSPQKPKWSEVAKLWARWLSTGSGYEGKSLKRNVLSFPITKSPRAGHVSWPAVSEGKRPQPASSLLFLELKWFPTIDNGKVAILKASLASETYPYLQGASPCNTCQAGQPFIHMNLTNG